MIMDIETYDSEDESSYSFTNIPRGPNERPPGERVQAKSNNGDLGDVLHPDLTLACQTKKPDQFAVSSRPVTSRMPELDYDQSLNLLPSESHFLVNYETILKLKESTRKLLNILEEIQSKTHSKQFDQNDATNFLRLPPIPQSNEIPNATDAKGAKAIQKLEEQTKQIDSINIQDEEDDCSVYKRLTRKCHCLNQNAYNDFIIHFNEDTKYRTSIAGEIIKNLRILKKFLYMNGKYTKNALIFLNEGLSESAYTEKVEIIQGCAHADICNIFEEFSIVATYIAWPFKNTYFGDSTTQELTASLIFKLTQVEEGRRYLNYSTKICNNIKKILRKKASDLQFETVETLNSIINILNPPFSQNMNVTYYCKPIDEGMGKKTVQSLTDYRRTMTLEEVFNHLGLLQHMSNSDKGKTELMTFLPDLLILFKQLLVEFDNSEMNIVLTNILNNIVTSTLKETDSILPNTLIIADVATEPIQMKNQMNQIPIPAKKNAKKAIKSKLNLSNLGTSPNKFRTASRRKVAERKSAPRSESVPNWERPGLVRSQKFSRRNMMSSIIVVPMEKD